MLLLAGSSLFAQTEMPIKVSDEEQGSPPAAHVLSPVVVHATTIETGENTIGGGELEMMPSTTGSATEALKGMSQIQYDYEQRSSLTLGEIAPPRISISGAKPYENNFMINGMSISNTLNPSGLNHIKSAVDLTVGGSDANTFFDTDLIESVTVYSSNIPAKYGGFLGGVVDANLRAPRADRWRFRIKGRYTEDSWFKLRNVDNESDSPTNQPKFKIYSTGVSADGPLNDVVSLLLSTSRQRSIIPLKRTYSDGITTNDEQERTNENYFARLILQPEGDLTVSFDVTYAPYDALYWDATFRDSEWTIENRSWRFASQADYVLPAGAITGKVAYAQNGFSRDSVSNYRFSDSDNRFGALGDIKIKNREFDASVSFTSDDFLTAGYSWKYTTGLDYGYKHADMWSEEITIESLLPSRRTVQAYEGVAQSRHNSSLGGHLQTEVTWKRLLLRPGARVDYDRFSGNVDVAPRFKAEYDLFGNRLIRLGVGANRYYGQHLRAYAFRRHRPIHTQIYDIQIDGSEIPRSPTVGTSREYGSDGLATPYSDELTGEVVGFVAGFDYGFTAIRRKHKKQLISKTEDRTHYFLTNDGKSDFRGLNFFISHSFVTQSFGRHRVSFNITKSQTNTVNGSYDADVTVVQTLSGYELSYDSVFYNGKYILRSDLPAENYNSPTVFALTISSSFFNDHLRVMSVSRWRGSSKGLTLDRRLNNDTPYGTISGSHVSASNLWVNPEGGYSHAYRSGKISGGAVTDLKFEVDIYCKNDYVLTLVGEVVNIFNGRMETGGVIDETRIVNHGRGFYAGMQVNF